MAAPACMSDDGNTAVFIGTYLESGETIAVCDECMVAWSAAMLNAMTGIDPTPFLQAISEDAPEEVPPAEPGVPAAPAETAEEAPPPSPNGRSGRSRAKSPGAGMGDAPPGEHAPASEPSETPAA